MQTLKGLLATLVFYLGSGLFTSGGYAFEEASSSTGDSGSSGGYLCEFGFDCVDHIGAQLPDLTSSTAPFANVRPDNVILPQNDRTFVALVSSPLSKCASLATSARAACLPPVAPGLAGAMAAVQTGMGILKTLAGTSAVCGKAGQILKQAETAMMTYNAACGGAATLCVAQCKMASKVIDSNLHLPSDAHGFKEKAAFASIKASETTTACMTYTKNLAALGVGLVTQKMQAHMGDECKKATSVTSVTRDCSDPNEARNNIACICEINPRAAGCPGSAARGDVAKAQGNSTPTASGALPNSANTKNSGSDSMAKASGASSGAGSGGPAAGGGSGAGAGSVMDGALPGNSQAKLKASGLDANILAGEWSGGGGGRAGGGGYNFEDPASARYKAFMPGGAKDPVRQLASDPYAGQVTGAGGKSNFDKISERYSETRSSLLSQ